MLVIYSELKEVLKRVLLNLFFAEEKAELCATIFANNSRDGVYSHGLNRFPVFVSAIKDGLININSEPELIDRNGLIERWEGNLAPGMYNANKAMDRSIELAKTNGIGCVSLRNTNHWMRGGTYGWQAADAGCIGICFSNTIANMPPWGGKEPRLGNNPLVIAVPRENGHIVLDMAMSQFSYGKLQENVLNERQLPVPGGYDADGNLTVDPASIIKSLRPLPVGFWKGSGLSFVLDVLATALSNGLSVGKITATEKEIGLSQIFICLYQNTYHEELIEQIIEFTKSSTPANSSDKIYYPGEKTLLNRKKSEVEGVFVDRNIWDKVLHM